MPIIAQIILCFCAYALYKTLLDDHIPSIDIPIKPHECSIDTSLIDIEHKHNNAGNTTSSRFVTSCICGEILHKSTWWVVEQKQRTLHMSTLTWY